MLVRCSALALLAGVAAFGQTPTTLNLGTQGRNADFSNFSFTRPIATGPAMPATCELGQLYFDTTAPAGQNLLACAQPNTWTSLGSTPEATSTTLGGIIVPAGSGLSLSSGVLGVMYGTAANTALQGNSLGQANGVASLDHGGNVPTSQLGNLGSAAFLSSGTFDAAGTAAKAVSQIPTSGAATSAPALITPTDWSTFANKQVALGFTPENTANKAQAGGYASLNSSGQVPSTQLPTIPSKTSQLTNDAGYVNSTQAASAAPVQSVNGRTGAVITNYNTVDNNGSAMTARSALNLKPGTNVTLSFADNSANNSTDVTISSAGTAAFGALSGGTNTGAAMLCGTGCSFGPSASGTVTANAFSGSLSLANGGTNATTAAGALANLGAQPSGNYLYDPTSSGIVFRSALNVTRPATASDITPLLPAFSGDTSTAAGSTLTTTSRVNGTSVPINSSSDQALVTTAAQNGSWLSLPSCLDSSGQHLNYNTSTHTFLCGTTGANVGSAAFNALTSGTNTGAAMLCGTGCSFAPTASGTVTANAYSGTVTLANGGTNATTASGALANLGGQPAGNYLVDPAASGLVFRSALNTTRTATSTDIVSLLPAFSGDATTSAASTVTTVKKVNGTSVGTNSASDQALVTTAAQVGSWMSLPSCVDSGGNHLNYNTTTHSFICGNTGGSVASAGFGALTAGTNTAASMLVGPGASLAPTGTGTITANQYSGALSTLPTYNNVGANGTNRKLNSKLGDFMSVLDFAGVDPTFTTDSTAGVQNAVNAACAAGTNLYVPPGIYMLTPTLAGPAVTLCSNLEVVGEANATFKVANQVGAYGALMRCNNCSNLAMEGMTFDDNISNNPIQPVAVISITATAGGSGYTSAPGLAIAGCTGFAATATLSSGAITGFTMTDLGTCTGSKNSAATVTITGGGGSGATATANLDAEFSNSYPFGRIQLQLYGCTNCSFSHNIFQNSSAKNAIQIDPGQNDTVTDNIFTNIGGDPNLQGHDMSTIYGKGPGITASNNVLQAATLTLGTYAGCSATSGSNVITCPSSDNPQASVHWIGNSITAVNAGTTNGTTLNSTIVGIGGAGIFYTRDDATNTSTNVTVTVTTFAGYAGALAAVEMHGSGETIIGNTITGYNKFLQLSEATSNTESIVANNNVDAQAAGIDIWAVPLLDHTGAGSDSYSFDSLAITGNTIRIHQMTFYSPNALYTTNAIYCDASSKLPLRNVLIANNVIKYDPESIQAAQAASSIVVSSNVATITVTTPVILLAADTVSNPDYVYISGSSTAGLNKAFAVAHVASTTVFTVATSGVSNGTYSGTVGLMPHRNSGDYSIGCVPGTGNSVPITNIAIMNNQIDRSPLSAIRFSSAVTLTGLKISGNQIRDAGSTADSTQIATNTSAIMWNLTTPVIEATVTDNVITDDQNPNLMPYAFWLASGSGTSNVVFRDNLVNITGSLTGDFAGYFNLDSNTKPLVQMVAPNVPWSSTSTGFAVGSQVWDETSNKMYQVLTAGQPMVAGSLSLIVAAPTTTGQTCTPGTWANAAGYYYACQPNGTWGRAALTTY